MTQREFFERTGVELIPAEFEAVHMVYCCSELDKDEFCKVWCKMNPHRVQIAKQKRAELAKIEALNRKLFAIWERDTRLPWEKAEGYACDYYTDREKRILEDAGISINGGTMIFSVTASIRQHFTR